MRAKNYPSIQEIGYFKSVFAVPPGAWEKRYKNSDRYVVRWRWRATIKVKEQATQIVARLQTQERMFG